MFDTQSHFIQECIILIKRLSAFRQILYFSFELKLGLRILIINLRTHIQLSVREVICLNPIFKYPNNERKNIKLA